MFTLVFLCCGTVPSQGFWGPVLREKTPLLQEFSLRQSPGEAGIQPPVDTLQIPAHRNIDLLKPTCNKKCVYVCIYVCVLRLGL